MEKGPFLFMRGRVALYAILKAMGIGRGDEVILQAFTCLAVPTPIILLGARPVYVDINSNGYTMDVDSLERAITGRTRAIVVQHTFGIPADMDKIVNMAGKHGISIVEDCCHAVGSKYEGREVGTFGVAAFYSTEWAKPVNTGIGGILILNEGKYRDNIAGQYAELGLPPFKDVVTLKLQYFLHETLLRPSVYWKIRDLYRFFSKKGMIIGTFSKEEIDRKIPGYFYCKMSSWQKRLLDKGIARAGSYVSGRKILKDKYDAYLKGLGVPVLSVREKADPVLVRYPLLVNDKEGVLEKAKEARVEMGNWFATAVHPVEDNGWAGVGYEKGSCPEAERKAKCCVNLPMHSKLREKDVDRMFGFVGKNKGNVLGSCEL